MSQSNTLRAARVSDSVPLNAGWQIRNTTTIDLVVINASAAEDQPDAQFYEQALTTLNTTEEQDHIAAGASGTFRLDDTVPHRSDDTTGAAVFNIIIARADSLFPVKLVSLAPDNETGSYPVATVTGEDASSMMEAARFRQTISAFPTSALAQAYADALATSDPDQADAFFRSTTDFSKLNISMVAAIETFYQVYPFVWTDYKDDKTYYLYVGDGSYLGSIKLENGCPIPTGVDKSTPGFTITCKPDDKSAGSKTLYYADGQFVDDTATGSPAICLQGMFKMKSELTKIETDNQVIAVLTGAVNGQTVMGYDQKPVRDSEGGWAKVKAFFNDEDNQKYLEITGIVVASILVLAVLAKVMANVVARMRGGAGKKPTPEEIKQMNERLRVRTQKVLDKLGSRANRNLRLPEDPKASWATVKTRANELLQSDTKARLESLLDRQGEYVNKLLENGQNNRTLQEVYEDISFSYDDLRNLRLDDPVAKFDALVKKINENTTTLNQQADVMRKKLSSEDRASVDRSRKAIEDVKAQVEDNKKMREILEEDKIPEEEIIEIE